MRTLSLAVLLSVSLLGAVHAQAADGVTVSTDPGKAAAVERHAQALKAAQPSASQAARPMKQQRAMHAAHHAGSHPRMHASGHHPKTAVKHAAALK